MNVARASLHTSLHRLLVRPLANQRQQDSLAKQAAADADAKADEDELQRGASEQF